jgi:hypothetical protein
MSVHHLMRSTVAASVVVACTAPAPPVGSPTPQSESMQRMLVNVDTIRAFVAGRIEQRQAEDAALELVSWSAQMGELFPPGTASQYVDMTEAAARGARDAMLSRATRLAEIVRTGNRPDTGEQLAETEKGGCGYCHRRAYR